MYKTTLRAAPRRIAAPNPLINNSRRFVSTAPRSQKSRSWKNTFFRWGLAGAGIYWYNTNPIFNNLDSEAVFLGQPTEDAIESVNDSIHSIQESDKSTIDAILAEKRAREAQLAAANKKSDSQFDQVAAADGTASVEGEQAGDGDLEGLEEEAGQQGAFNPETGEINWDCPCLGGMAHGPCGDEFREAFSCFVYSTEEPKGVECIEKFKGMQDCFRLHPEMYGSELEDDEDEVEEAIREQQERRAQDDGRDESEAGESREGESATKSAPSRVAPTSTPPSEVNATDDETASKKDHEQVTKSSNSDWSASEKEQNEAAEKAVSPSAQK